MWWLHAYRNDNFSSGAGDGLECAVVATRAINAGEALLLSSASLGSEYEEDTAGDS